MSACSLAVYGVIGIASLVLGGVPIERTPLPATEIAPARYNLSAGVLLFALGLGLRRLAASQPAAP